MRYVMPADSGYELEQDAVYTLPVRGGGPIDVAPSTSLLWMALNNEVRLTRCREPMNACVCHDVRSGCLRGC